MTSFEIFESSKKINIIATLVAILIGLLGHFIIIIILGQKRFRTNSSNIYLLCLAVNDSLFLIVHLFEDTIRTYIDVYVTDQNSDEFLSKLALMLDITDKYDLSCRLMNYFRFVLRFTSSYILVIFSLQRLYIVNSPLNNRFKSKKCAWFTCFLVLLISIIINTWALVLFELQKDDNIIYCDVSRTSTMDYFHIPAIYISIDMVLPIVIILTCNTIIIYKLKVASFKRQKLNIFRQRFRELNQRNQIQQSNANLHINQQKINTSRFSTMSNLSKNTSMAHHLFPFKEINSLASGLNSEISSNFRLRPYYSPINHLNKTVNTVSDSRKTTKNLLLISFIFVFLNMPFLLTWFALYYQIAFANVNLETKDFLLAALQICEIFHILNYSILFYVYCALGSKFRSQLKSFAYSSKKRNVQIEFYVEDFKLVKSSYK